MTVKRWIFTLFFIAGIGMILSPIAKDILVKYISAKYVNISDAELKHNQGAEVTYYFDDISSIGLDNVISALNKDLPIIGKIEIPSVCLSLPIIKGVSNDSMSVGAGTLRDNQQLGKGNYPLASHHMKNPNLLFSPLDRVEIGDDIYLSDSENMYIYKVIEKETVSPEKVDVIEDKDGQTLVTLITCSVNGTKRLIVIGELIEEGGKSNLNPQAR